MAAVAHLSTGVGDTDNASPLAWNHTIASSGATTVVLVAVSVSTSITLGDFTDIDISATYNGVEMNLLAWSETGRLFDFRVNFGGGAIALFYLFNPPTGTRQVVVSAEGFTVTGLSGNSAAYSNCIGFGPITRSHGSGAKATVATITDDRAVAVFSTGAAPTGASGTQRFSVGASYVGTGDYVSLQDTAGNIEAELSLTNWGITGLRTIGVNLVANTSKAERCKQILAATRRHRREEERIRRTPPLVRVWDAEWDLHDVMRTEYSAQFTRVSNDSGPARTELPMGTHLAEWIHEMDQRVEDGEGRNVFCTVDYCGAREGYMLDKSIVELNEDGDRVLVVDWLHDYEKLKWYQIWSNPFTIPAVQIPRAFVLPGPVTWILKLALFLNIFREHNPLVTIVDDPLELASWFTSLDQSNWPVVVKPTSFLEAMASGVVWGVVFSRWKNWHDMANVMLEDAELSVVPRRYLRGDPPPWEGADLRYGTLWIDIVDKSGTYVGTRHGGTIFDGLGRTVAEFAEDFIDSTLTLAEDATYPVEYQYPWSRLTKKEFPYAVYRQVEGSAIQSSKLITSPSKGVQVNVGGHSMPGVNETISASIQAVGDLVGSVFQIGSLGGSIDALAQPLYEDTILAWWSHKSLQRAANSGWDRYFEYQQQPTGKAYTIASLMVLRAGFWATRTVVSWEIDVADGRPFLIGDNGVGHWFIDDRIGLVLEGSTRIHMDRCRKLDLAWDEDNPPEWRPTVGDPRVFQDPMQRGWGRIEQITAGLHELGVW